MLLSDAGPDAAYGHTISIAAQHGHIDLVQHFHNREPNAGTDAMKQGSIL